MFAAALDSNRGDRHQLLLIGTTKVRVLLLLVGGRDYQGGVSGGDVSAGTPNSGTRSSQRAWLSLKILVFGVIPSEAVFQAKREISIAHQHQSRMRSLTRLNCAGLRDDAFLVW